MSDTLTIAILFGVLTVLSAAVALARGYKPIGPLCRKCRYLLGPTPNATRCPECGTPTSRVIVADRSGEIRQSIAYALISAMNAFFFMMLLGLDARTWLAKAFYTGPHSVRTISLSAHAVLPSQSHSKSLYVTAMYYVGVLRSGATRPRQLTLDFKFIASTAPPATVALRFPLSAADDAALREFLEQARASAQTLGIHLDPARGYQSFRANIDRAPSEDGPSPVVALLQGWLPDAALLAQGGREEFDRKIAGTPRASQPVAIDFQNSPIVEIPSPELRRARMWAWNAMLWSSLPYAIVLVSLAARPVFPKTAPWPPKNAGEAPLL